VNTPDTGNSRASSVLSPQMNNKAAALPVLSQGSVGATKYQSGEIVPQSSPQDHQKQSSKAQKLRNETMAMRENDNDSGAVFDDEFYTLSDDEASNTNDRLVAVPATTGIAAVSSSTATRDEPINQSKLRVIKNIAKARELEGQQPPPQRQQQQTADDHIEEAKPTINTALVASTVSVPASVSTPQSKSSSSSYTATLSNTFRRMRGRTNSEVEDHGTPLDDRPNNEVSTNSSRIVSDAKDIATVEKEACEAWERYLKLNDSVITDIFGGLLQSTVQCCTCNHRSFAFDPFLDLSIPIFKEGESSSTRGLFPSLTLRSNGHQENKSTLEKCLEKFTGKSTRVKFP
jgi:hypothetical protein